jgi:hypothetical protein
MSKIQVRRGTAAQWTAANPTLGAGEFGYITSGTGAPGYKLGDGNTPWNTLGYAASGAFSPTPNSLTITNAFSNAGTWNGSTALTLDLPATIPRNALTASALATPRTINGDSFDGSANVFVSGAVYGATASAAAAFRDIYVSPATSIPTSPNTGDVWIAY